MAVEPRAVATLGVPYYSQPLALATDGWVGVGAAAIILSAELYASSALQAGLEVIKLLRGDLGAVTVLEAPSLTNPISLLAALSAGSSLAGDLYVEKALSAAALGTGALDADIQVVKGMTGWLVGDTQAQSQLEVVKNLGALVNGIGVFSAGLESVKSLRADLGGEAAVAADLEVYKQLFGVLSAVSQLNAQLEEVGIVLTASLSGTAEVTAVLDVEKALSAGLDATSELFAALEVLRIVIQASPWVSAKVYILGLDADILTTPVSSPVTTLKDVLVTRYPELDVKVIPPFTGTKTLNKATQVSVRRSGVGVKIL